MTASAPNSPTRDATFQFPECAGVVVNGINNSNVSPTTSLENLMGVNLPTITAPVPSPRPKPRRRRLTSEGSLPDKADVIVPTGYECSNDTTNNHGNCCCVHHHLANSLDESEWASVGANLRTIADDFHASKAKVSFFLYYKLIFFIVYEVLN